MQSKGVQGMAKRILMAVENLGMGGMKRAATVVGNAMTEFATVAFYQMADVPSYYELKGRLISAPHPVMPANGPDPLHTYQQQMTDLADILIEEKIDVVILNAGILTSFIPYLKSRLPELKTIAWMHNNIDTYFNQYYRDMRAEFVAGVKAADTVVALTETDLEGFQTVTDRAVKIWNPLTMPVSGRADLTKHTIAFTGRIAIQHKGIDIMLNLAKKLPDDWQIAIAGEGLPDDMASFERLIKANEVADKILYRGGLHDEELAAHYRQASIFLATSRWEGLPLVLVEAMSFGLPVLSTDNTGAVEILDGGIYGELAAKNADALWYRLEPMLQSYEMRCLLATKSLERAKDFELSAILAKWQDIVA